MDDLKKALRCKTLQMRNELPAEKRLSANKRITQLFLQTDAYQACKHLLLYASYGSEVDTYAILEHALSQGKNVFFPKVEGENMTFYQVWKREDLKPGYRGIPEPDILDETGESSSPKIEKPGIWNPKSFRDTLLVYPGVAFDPKCNRIGYGKGFYDRFTRQCRINKQLPESIALAYHCQLLPEIPVQEHDEKPDQILTETKRYSKEIESWERGTK